MLKISNTIMLNSGLFPEYTKLDTFLYLPYFEGARHILQKMQLIDNSYKRSAFTLAETLITLSVLGIVAALTIPSVVRKQIEASNRVKIKKAMGVYETMMSKIVVENDLKSNAAIQAWNTPDEDGNYPVSNYIKYTKYANDSKCQFCAADKVCYNFCDIQSPIIALNEKDLNEETAQSRTNRAFYLFAQYDGQGILRITEPQFTYSLTTGANTNEVNASVARLYDFINGKTSTTKEEIAVNNSGTRACSNSTKNSSGNFISCMQALDENEEFSYFNIYDENGNKDYVRCATYGSGSRGTTQNCWYGYNGTSFTKYGKGTLDSNNKIQPDTTNIIVENFNDFSEDETFDSMAHGYQDANYNYHYIYKLKNSQNQEICVVDMSFDDIVDCPSSD